MIAALWKYMTPFPPKPSLHDIMVKKFVPSSEDLSMGLRAHFASTIVALKGNSECGPSPSDSGK